MSKREDDKGDHKYNLERRDSSEEFRRKKKAKKKEEQKLNKLKAYKSDNIKPISLNTSDIRILKDKKNENNTNEIQRKSRSLNDDNDFIKKSRKKRSKSRDSKKRKSSKINKQTSGEIDKKNSKEKTNSGIRVLIEPQIDVKRRVLDEGESKKKKKLDYDELFKKKSTDSDIKKKLEEEIKKKLNDEELKKQSINLDLNKKSEEEIKKKKKLSDLEIEKKSTEQNKKLKEKNELVLKKSTSNEKETDSKRSSFKDNEEKNDKVKLKEDIKRSDTSLTEESNFKIDKSTEDGFNYLYQFDQLNMPSSKTSISNIKYQSLSNLKTDESKQLPQSLKEQKSITQLTDVQSTDALEQIKTKLGEQNYLRQDRPSGYEKQQQKRPKSSVSQIDQEQKLDDIIKITTKEVPRQLSKEALVKKGITEQVSKETLKKDNFIKDIPKIAKEIGKTKSLSDLEDEKRKDKKLIELKKAKSDQNLPIVKIQNEKDKKEINIKASNSLKANLSLGNTIKAKIDNQLPQQKDEIKADNKDNQNDQDDWSSISIQLDITKDPKTKKIEINEDVKVLTPPKSKDDKNKSIKKLEESNEDLEIKKKELLESKPSITHYIKKDKQHEIKQDTNKFSRFFTSSSETDISESEELKRIIRKRQDKDEISKENLETQQNYKPKTIQQDQSKETKSVADKNLDQQAVVLYKADTESDKRSASEGSSKSLKRMDLLKIDKKSLDKKKMKDSSSDEQTYEQFINKRNETLKLHFPTLNISPPLFKPTPPPFHLKIQTKSKDLTPSDKSEELTYHEQKRKFSLKPTNKIKEENEAKSIDTSSSLELSDVKNELKRSKDYENIKKLDIPSEKKAELEKQQDLLVEKLSKAVKKYDELKDDLELRKKEEKIDYLESKTDIEENFKLKDKLKKQIEVKIDKKDRQQKLVKEFRKQQTTKDEEDDELSENLKLINKFNNEIERLRRLERYLIKVKLILNNDQAEIEIKKKVIKRLILIKKDLNRLIKICDQLIDKKYLINNKKKRSPSKRYQINDGSLSLKNKLNYSDESNDEESERSINLFDKIDRLDKRKDDKFKKKKNRIKDDYDKFIRMKKPKEYIRRNANEKDESKKSREHFQIYRDIGGKFDGFRKSKEQRDDSNKFNEFRKSKEYIQKEDDKLQELEKKIKTDNLTNLRNTTLTSTFKYFLFLIIILILLFSYCYYKRNRIPKKFPCRLKRKDL